jgi:hypothetical protein
VTGPSQAEVQVQALKAELEQRVIERNQAEMALHESELRLRTDASAVERTVLELFRLPSSGVRPHAA